MVRWKIARRFALLFSLCASVYALLYIFLPASGVWEYDESFDYECRKNGSVPFPNVIHYCIQDASIFFVETSSSRVLNVRQACAVESAARHNPAMPVSVLMTGDHVSLSHPLMRSLLKSSPNVVFQAIDIDVFTHDTPLWVWYRTGKWKKSQWKKSHLSDALRFLVMWKHGGIYLDLDTVSLRPMDRLHNAVVTENWQIVAAGILVFERRSELMSRCVEDFAAHYDKDQFAYNGPGVIARNILKFCNVGDIGKVSGSNCNVNVLPPEAAFPVPYDKWEEYFEPGSRVHNVSTHFNSSYLIHVWNKYSATRKLPIGTRSLYEIAMAENCPTVYEHALNMTYV